MIMGWQHFLVQNSHAVLSTLNPSSGISLGRTR